MLSPRQLKGGMVQPAEGGTNVEAPIGLGELAGLTVTNEAGPLLNVSVYQGFNESQPSILLSQTMVNILAKIP